MVAHSRILPLLLALTAAGCFVTDSDLDADGDGFNPTETGGEDCDDSSAAIAPDQPEICGNGVDDNCDGRVDYLYALDGSGLAAHVQALAEGDARITDGNIFGLDTDGDGYGQDGDVIRECPGAESVILGSGDGARVYVPDPTDCNDQDPDINPGEVDNDCDGVDDNCSGEPDENQNPDTEWWPDRDNDDWGDDSNPDRVSIGCPPTDDAIEHWADRGGDCNDDDNEVHPGAEDICDGKNNDCEGRTDEFVIGDGEACPAESCEQVHAWRPDTGDGEFWVDGRRGTVQVKCVELTVGDDRRGWMLVDLESVESSDRTILVTTDSSSGPDAARAEWYELDSGNGILLRPRLWEGRDDFSVQGNLDRCHSTEASVTIEVPYDYTEIQGSFSLTGWRARANLRHEGTDSNQWRDLGDRGDCNDGAILVYGESDPLQAPGYFESLDRDDPFWSTSFDSGELLAKERAVVNLADAEVPRLGVDPLPQSQITIAVNDGFMEEWEHPGIEGVEPPPGGVNVAETGGVITEMKIYVR